jgi:hypothetical protein
MNSNGYPYSPQRSPATVASPNTELPVTQDSVAKAFELSLPDLRLVYHWTATCYATFNVKTGSGELYAPGLIELGFEHPFLLHGILALSAAHLASFRLPAERQDLLLNADSHISLALETYRRNLEAPNAETAVPMFVLSSVLLTYNFGMVQERPEDPIRSVHHCFMLLAGIKVVVVPHWEQMQKSDIFQRMTALSSPAMNDELDLRARNDPTRDILNLLELTEVILDTQDREACVGAIQELHTTWLRYRHKDPGSDDYGIILAWPARLNNRFYDLLSQHEPISCIITTHFAAILAKGRELWWVSKWPRWILSACEDLLVKTPDLLKWLAWPRLLINGQSWQNTIMQSA